MLRLLLFQRRERQKFELGVDSVWRCQRIPHCSGRTFDSEATMLVLGCIYLPYAPGVLRCTLRAMQRATVGGNEMLA